MTRKKPKRKSQQEILNEWIERYRAETGSDSVDTNEVASWMMRQGWNPKPSDARKLLAKELSVAMRAETFRDPKGRKVRRNHAEKIVETDEDGNLFSHVIWHKIDTAKRPQMQAAFQLRRSSIVDDCHRLRQDVDSYNEFFNSSVDIQMEFDFRDDLADLAFDEEQDG